MTTYFGIDFGTTYSTVSLLTKGGVLIYKQNGSAYIPTTLFISEDEKTLKYGFDAEEAYVKCETGKYYRDLKRYVGCNDRNLDTYLSLLKPKYDVSTEKVGDSERSSALISAYNEIPNSKRELCVLIALYLKSLISSVEKQLNIKCDGIILSVPAGYTCLQRVYMEKCCSLSGYACVSIINEPSAASICTIPYLLENQHDVLIYDFGGGTFDVSCVSIYGTSVAVIGSGSDMNLGGRDIDAAFEKYLKDKHNIDDTVKIPTTSLKEALSLSSSPVKFSARPCVNDDIVVNSHELARVATEFIQRSINVMTQLIEELNFNNKKFIITLVGGSSNLPGVKGLLKNLYFCDNILDLPDSRAAVSVGCALYSKAFDSDASLILVDAASKDLGIASNKGNMLVLAPRAAPLPFNGVTSITYPQKKPSSLIHVCIYEGRYSRVLYNELLASSVIICSELGHTIDKAVDIVLSYETMISTTGKVVCKITGPSSQSVTLQVQSVFDFSSVILPDMKVDDKEERLRGFVNNLFLLSFGNYLNNSIAINSLRLEDLSNLDLTSLAKIYNIDVEKLHPAEMVLRSDFPGVLWRNNVSFLPFRS
ncbi:heat shock 70-like protein [Fig virus B]|uniref:HSP70 n=1 Tax=Fig closterovirus 1 TaxID=2809010 RepID=A0A8A0XZ14_9CLOS|nr:heat shock 70-like protein [Fig virus B]QSQ86320.1 HSP70 [Fig closterovirus 1]